MCEDNLESVQDWVEVIQEQSSASKRLIEYVLANHENLLDAGREAVADAVAPLAGVR